MKHITILNARLIYQKKLLTDVVFIDLLSGFFPKILKRRVCKNRDIDCRLCELKDRCAYAYLFEPILTGEKSLVVSLPDIKIPFAFKWNFEKERTDFSLCLFAKSRNFTYDIMETLSEIGDMGLGRERFKFKLTDISNADLNFNSTNPINYSHKDLDSLSMFEIDEIKRISQGMPSLNLRIRFQSDFDLFRSNKRFKGERIFSTFYRRIRDRIRALYEIYLDEDLPMEIKGLSDRCEGVIERETERNTFEFKGSISPFKFPFLLGVYLNMGRRCAFGKGSYKIIT